MTLRIRHRPPNPKALIVSYHCTVAAELQGTAIASVEVAPAPVTDRPATLQLARQAVGAAPDCPVALVGFSRGCQAVRSLLTEQPAAVMTIDGTHSSWPVNPTHVEWWRELAAKARRGSVLWVATCTRQTYTERLPTGAFASTVTVLEAATGLDLRRPDLTRYASGGLIVESHPSADMDGPAHTRQVREVLPRLVRDLVPWLQLQSDGPDTDPAPPASDTDPSPLTPWGMRALAWTITQLGVSEATKAGQDTIEGYHAEVGGQGWLTFRSPWCASFASTACKRTQQPGDPEPPHALTFRVRDIWSSAIERKTAVPISAVRKDPKRYLHPGNLLIMSRGDLPHGEGADAFGSGHVTRIEGYTDGPVRCVDGNKADQVKRVDYDLDDPHLVGVVLYPGGDSTDTWKPTEKQLDEMIAMAEEAFESRST